MELDTVEDIRQYIKKQYGLAPKVYEDNYIEYDRVYFKRNSPSALEANKDTRDMWTVGRTGHSVDYMRTAELQQQIQPGGGLLYFIFPLERAMDGI